MKIFICAYTIYFVFKMTVWAKQEAQARESFILVIEYSLMLSIWFIRAIRAHSFNIRIIELVSVRLSDWRVFEIKVLSVILIVVYTRQIIHRWTFAFASSLIL